MEPTIADWLQVIAAFLTMSAAIAAARIASKAPERAAYFAEKRRAETADEEDLRRFRMNVLQALMKGRRALAHPDTIAALNLVDLAFHDSKPVRSAYRLFIAATETSGEEIVERYFTLVSAVCAELGLGDDIREDDLRLGFYPDVVAKIDAATIADAEEKIARKAASEIQGQSERRLGAFDAFRSPKN